MGQSRGFGYENGKCSRRRGSELLANLVFGLLRPPKNPQRTLAARWCVADVRMTMGAGSATRPLDAILASLRACSSKMPVWQFSRSKLWPGQPAVAGMPP